MNPSRSRGGARLVARAVFIMLFAVGARAFGIDAADAEKKTPAEWVAQLGAEHLAQRDEASAALLALGCKARDAVHAALDSKDAEIQVRARELWKTLRWDVVPGAEQETAKIMADAGGFYVSNYASAPGAHLDTHDPPGKADDEDNNKQDDDQWRSFVKAQGASTLLLIAEMRAAGFSSRTYRAGVVNLLERVPAKDLVQFVISHKAAQASLVAPLNVIVSGNLDQKGAAADVRMRAAVGDGRGAYDFAHAMFIDYGGYDEEEHLIAACVDAIRQSGNFEMARTQALNDVKGEPDVKMLTIKLEFHVGVMAGLGRKDCIGELCDAMAARTDMAVDSDWNWPLINLAKELNDAGLPDRTLKILRNAKDPLLIYIRSHAETMLKNTAAADAEWDAAQKAADTEDPDTAKGRYYEIAETMRDWNDPRAEGIYRKIIAMPATKHQDLTNPWMRLGDIAEERKQYSEAADDYEKAMEAFKQEGGIMSTTDSEGGINQDGSTDGNDFFLSKIKELRAEAAKSKHQ